MIDAAIAAIVGAWVFLFAFPFFWITLVAWFALMVWWTEDESYFLATIVMIGFIWGVSAVDENGISFSLIDTLKYAGLYFVIGAAWSFVKWVSFLFKKRDKLKKHKVDFLEAKDGTSIKDVGEWTRGALNENADDSEAEKWDFQNPTASTEIPEELIKEFKEYLYDHNYLSLRSHDIIPNIADHKGDVVHWIVWWPFSAFWTLLDDPIRRIAELIYRNLQGVYRGTANKIFSDFK